MTINYAIAPSPRVYFFDTTGKPLINGYLYTYRSIAPEEPKSIYQEPSGSIDYPNPVRLDGVGSMPAPYWADDEKYYIRVHDQNDQLVFDYDDYPTAGGAGGGPITIEVDYQNYLLNGQFRFTSYKSMVLTPSLNLLFWGSGWTFQRSNGTSSVTLTRGEFFPGTPPDTIEANPKYFFRYDCSAAGSGETLTVLRQSIPDVRSFNGKTISICFVARSSTLSNVTVMIGQGFGTGGAPSPYVFTTLGSVKLTNTFTKYHFTITVPSIAGKNIGTNLDDAFEVFISYPLNATALIDITNIQLNLGSRNLPYQYETAISEMGKNFSTLMLDRQEYWEDPTVTPIEDIRYLTFAKTAYLEKWEDQSELPLYGTSFALMANPPIGATLIWWVETPPEGWLLVGGQAIAKSFSPRLYAVLGDRYTSPTSTSNTSALVSGSEVAITMTAAGSVVDAFDYNTGFAFTVIQQGDNVDPEKFKIACNDAASLVGGEYFFFQTPDGTDWVHYYIKDLDYSRTPSTPGYRQTWTHIKTGDSAEDIARKTQVTFAPLTFNLPLPNGLGFRAVDGGVGRDPDRATRFARPDGVGGDNVGSVQLDMYKLHGHSYGWNYKNWGPPGSGTQGTVASEYDPSYTYSSSDVTSNEGGNETRMKNINIYLIIKY